MSVPQASSSAWVILIPIVLSVALAACGSGSPASPSLAGTLPPHSIVPRESTRPSTPLAAGLDFAWPDGDRPTVSRALAGTDEAYINPGAVIDHEGELHMFANVFTAWPGRVEVPHLVSTDGETWTLVAAEPAFTSDDVPFAEPGADVSTGFVAEDGTWVLLFETVNQSGPWAVGIATAPGPDGPWTIAPEPVLEAGAPGSFDAAGLPWPSVVASEDGYALYYTASPTGNRDGAIARAVSKDGLAWTKSEAPVLRAAADWERGGLDRPRVARTADGYVMLYSGVDLTDRGVAVSPDGVTWERVGDAPAITVLDFPVSGRAWDAALVHRDGRLTYYLEIGTARANVGTDIYRATADLP